MVHAPDEASAPVPLLEVVVFAGESEQIVPIPPGGQVTFGRDSDNTVTLDDSAVSRRHAVLHAGPPLRFEDVGSRNGIQVRDQEALPQGGSTHELRQIKKKSVEVSVGDRVLIGPATVVVRLATVPVSSEARDTGPVMQDPAMRRCYDEAMRLAETPLSLLLLGEPGVGKDVMARAIHLRSPRAKQPFVAIDFSTITASLLEAQLFGYEKVFTGATEARPGLFEAADRGTVFLDEIGNLNADAQAKLLRVLQNREVRRMGALSVRQIDVRFISATNAALEDLVEEGKFRRDLYDRINGVTITIPPLRQRPLDIEPLATRFIAAFSAQMGRARAPRLSAKVLAALKGYDWPGNVRELNHALDRAVALSSWDSLAVEHLPEKVRLGAQGRNVTAPSRGAPESTEEASPVPNSGVPSATTEIREAQEAVMKQRLLEALEASLWNGTKAAQKLGISRRTLVNWMNRFPEVKRSRGR
ncbi:MAG: sigma 54-interacting transcriptional regulator [Byssovorax sp.]